VSDPQGPLAGQNVAFSIVATAGGESAGGATLSAASAVSGADGQAGVDLVAGAARAHFRVVAASMSATPVTFFASVSDQGFADLVVVPAHVGPRSDEPLGAVELRLYAAGVGCAGLSAESAPPPTYPARTVEPGATATFPSLATSDSFSLLGWTESQAGTILTDACVDIEPGQLRAGSMPTLELPLGDRPLALAARYDLTSTIDLFVLEQRLMGPGSAWAVLACPNGAAQLVLDCAIDLLDGGDAEDCVVSAPGPLAQSLEDARGAPDAAGCRSGGLDAAVMATLVADSGTRAAEVASAAGALADLLDSMSLTSTVFPGGSAGSMVLGSLGFEVHGGRFQLGLGPTARPLVAVPVVLAFENDSLEIGPAAFTIRLGRVLAASFAQVTPFSDGTDLAGGLLAGSSCTAVSQTACAAAQAASDCLAQACLDSRSLLGDVVEAPFAALDTDDVDLVLDGSALTDDANDDLVADRLSSGIWRATLHLSTGAVVQESGVFDGQ